MVSCVDWKRNSRQWARPSQSVLLLLLYGSVMDLSHTANGSRPLPRPLVEHYLRSGVGREIVSVDSDLGTPRRIIAVPFFHRDGLRGNALESLSDKQPLGARLGG